MSQPLSEATTNRERPEFKKQEYRQNVQNDPDSEVIDEIDTRNCRIRNHLVEDRLLLYKAGGPSSSAHQPFEDFNMLQTTTRSPRKKTRTQISTVSLFLFAASASSASADVLLRSDGISRLLPLTEGAQLVLPVTAGSSYCCELYASDTMIAARFSSSTIQIFPGPTAVTARFAGFDEPKSTLNEQRLCFAVPDGSVTSARFAVTYTPQSVPALTEVSCEETTLYGGFNTSVTDFNFLEVTNTLDRQAISGNITARVVAVNTLPEPDVSVLDTTGTVNAATRKDFDIHTPAGSGKFGTVKVSHNGALGALKAVVSQYNVTATSPTLDFEPVATDVLRTRNDFAGK